MNAIHMERMIKERQHGTRTKYVHDGCRCLPCKLANTDYETNRQALRRQREPWQARFAPEVCHWAVRNYFTGEIVHRTPDRSEAIAVRDRLNKSSAKETDQDPLWASPRLVHRVRRHIRECGDRGIGIHEMAKATGLGRNNIRYIVGATRLRNGRRMTPHLRYDTAMRILKYCGEPAAGQRVPAKETWRMLGEFIKAGFRKLHIAQALGQRGPGLQVSRNQVRLSTERRVRALHDEIWHQSPALRAVCKCPEWIPK